MAVGGDLPGNEIQSPMAKVILGGLFTSTLLNGLIVPIMYIISHKEKRAEEGNSNESDNSYNSYKSDNDE
jgi:Cu(I)/Ag(I) efflux system membrane protein CusA/SilA